MSTGLGPHLRLQQLGVLLHWCPACRRPHEIHLTAGTHPSRRKWEWNDNMARPTIWPALQVDAAGGGLCSYFITDGRLQFLSDSTHALAGQVVDLPCYPMSAMAMGGASPPAEPSP